MPATLTCPNCGTTVAVDPPEVDRDARCDRCGTMIDALAAAWNPYAAPSTSPGDQAGGPASDVPASVLGKFGLAVRLLVGNLGLFSLVILTVWLPVNVGIESIEANAAPGQEGLASFRLNSMAQGVFGPISIGALIFALARRMRGEPVTYLSMLAAGLRNWGRLFAANFAAGLMILGGYVCLIIPGIILQVRLALIDPVVVLEPAYAPRPRSRELTRGRFWQIFLAGGLFMIMYLPLAFGAGIAIESLELPDTFWVNVGADCILDIVSSISTIVMFLFYWESGQQPRLEAKVPESDSDEMFGGWKMSPAGGRYPE